MSQAIPPFLPGLPGAAILNEMSGLYRPTASNADLDRLFSTSVAIFAAANFWGETMSLIKWKVVFPGGLELDPTHLLMKALSENMPDILQRSMISEIFRGYNLIYKVVNPFNNQVTRLRWMNFNLYELDKDWQEGLVGWRIMSTGTNYKPVQTGYIDREDGIYWNLVDLRDDFDGTAPAEVAFMAAGVDTETAATALAFFQNMAIPTLLIQPDEAAKFAPGDKEVQDLRTLFRKVVRGVMNFGRTIITPARWQIQQLQAPFEEIDFDSIINTARDSVFMACDVPRTVVSGGGGSYAEAYEDRRQWLQFRFKPKAHKIASYFTDQLIHPIYPDAKVEPDFSDVPGMKEDEATQTATVNQQVAGLLIDLYSAQKKLDIEPDENLRGMYVVHGIPVPVAQLATVWQTQLSGGGGAGGAPGGMGGGMPILGAAAGGSITTPKVPASTTKPPTERQLSPRPPAPGKFGKAGKAASTDFEAEYTVLAYPDSPQVLIALQDTVRGMLGKEAKEVEWSAADTFHVTLVAAESDFADIQDSLPLNPGAFAVLLDGVSTFDTPKGFAIHLTVRGNGALEAAQSALVQTLSQRGIQVSPFSAPDAYTPHITLGYSPTDIDPFTIEPVALLINRLEVSNSKHEALTIQALKSTEDEIWLDDAHYKELRDWQRLIARKGIDYAFEPKTLPVESVVFGKSLLTSGYNPDEAFTAIRAHVFQTVKKNRSMKWDEDKHPRGEAGQFGAGAGGGVVETQEQDSEVPEEKISTQGDVKAFHEHTGQTPQQLAQVAGAGFIHEQFPDATTHVQMLSDRTALVSISTPDEKVVMTRRINFGDNGKPESITNVGFQLEDTGTGLGTKTFKHQVDEAAKGGFKRIDTEAGKGPGVNGYYTWARLGYDADVEGPKGKTRVSELMKTKAGRDWWKANGKKTKMSFDLTENSQGRRVLDAYQKEKFGG